MLHPRQRLRVVLDAEVGHALATAAEVGHERVVGVQHEARLAVQALDQLRPAVGQQLELAVAVELVAEQVGEQEQARVELVGDGRQPGLVDLEQPQLAAPAARVEQRGGDAPGHVRAGAVVDHGAARSLQAGRQHRRGGRLAVGGRDQQGALVEVARHLPERARREPQQQPARRGRPAAAAGAAADRPHDAGQRPRDAIHQPGAMTRRQRRSTRTVAGVLPIGSPSP